MKTRTIWYQYQEASAAWIEANPEKWAAMITHLRRYGRHIGLKKI